MDHNASPAAFRMDRLLREEPVVWLSSVRPDGGPHLVPIWFSWDGLEILIASKPNAQKIRNLRANPSVMLAELLDEPAAAILPVSHLAKYRSQMAAIGLSPAEFVATYSQVIRIAPTRVLPWRGRTVPLDPPAAAGYGLRGALASLVARLGMPRRPTVLAGSTTG
jgi:hypothetical protein